jgi:hypothetical protein
MSFKNFLDLRKKSPQQIKIVERIIFQKRSLKSDIFLALSVIIVASGIIWGISKADTLISKVIPEKINQRKSFSVVGVITDLGSTSISVQSSDDKVYVLDIDKGVKIETKNYTPITFLDLKIDDKIIVQGVISNEIITVKRVVSFSIVAVASVATSTEVTATSTIVNQEQVSTSTEENATSTNQASSTDSSVGIFETVKNAVADFVDSIVGTSTASTTIAEEVATTSPTTNTGDAATGTEAELINEASNVVEVVVGFVEGAISNVVNILTGNTNEVESPAGLMPESVPSLTEQPLEPEIVTTNSSQTN